MDHYSMSQLANDVYGKAILEDDSFNAIPELLLVIITAIEVIGPLLESCDVFSDKKTLSSLKHASVLHKRLQRVFAKRAVRKELGRYEYRAVRGDELVDMVIDRVYSLTPTQQESLVADAVKNGVLMGVSDE